MAFGHVIWSELHTHDMKRAKAFYAAVMGWTYQSMPIPGNESLSYVMPQKDGAPVMAGFFPMEGPEWEGMPEHWMTYLSVPDVDAAVETARKQGGTIIREGFDIPGVGRLGVFRDSGGATIAVMTAVEEPPSPA